MQVSVPQLKIVLKIYILEAPRAFWCSWARGPLLEKYGLLPGWVCQHGVVPRRR